MSTPKRPESPPEGGTSTLVTGPASDEEPQSEAPKTVEVAADDSENGGATAFLRAPPLRRVEKLALFRAGRRRAPA